MYESIYPPCESRYQWYGTPIKIDTCTCVTKVRRYEENNEKKAIAPQRLEVTRRQQAADCFLQ